MRFRRNYSPKRNLASIAQRSRQRRCTKLVQFGPIRKLEVAALRRVSAPLAYLSIVSSRTCQSPLSPKLDFDHYMNIQQDLFNKGDKFDIRFQNIDIYIYKKIKIPGIGNGFPQVVSHEILESASILISSPVYNFHKQK